MTTEVTPNNLDDKQKAKILENKILVWGEAVEDLVQDLPHKRYANELKEKVLKGEASTPATRKLLNEAFRTWDKAVHFLAVALGNIAKNIEQIPQGSCSSRKIETAGKNVLNEYNKPKVRDLRNLLEHEAEYIVGSKDRRKNLKPYVKNVYSGIQSACFPSKSNPNQVEIYIQIFDSPRFRIDPLIESVKRLHDAIQENRRPRKLSS